MVLLLWMGAGAAVATAAADRLTRDQALQELRLTGTHFTQLELKAAYRQRSLETHPDKAGGSNEAFVRVSEAYQVLVSSSSSQHDASSSSGQSSSGSTGRTSFSDDMSDAERVRMAEDMFFDAFGDLFDGDKVGGAIDTFFQGVEPTIWIRLLKGTLKWALPKIVGMIEGDNTIVSLNGVAMTGKEFKELRKRYQNQVKAAKARAALEPDL